MSNGGMDLTPFVWGEGGQRMSAEEAARRRQLAQSLTSQQQPRDYWSGVNSIVNNIFGGLNNRWAEEAETAGRSEYEGLLAQALESGATDIASLAPLLTHDFASSGGSALGQALLGQTMKQSDPLYQQNLERGNLELEALRNPVSDPFAGTQVINGQVVGMGDTGPQVLGDFRDAPGADAPSVQTFYDQETGLSYKAQWNPQTQGWDRVGGVEAPSGMTIRTNPDGTFEFTQGGVGGSNNDVLSAIDTAEQALRNIQGVIQHPSLGQAVGLGGMLPAIPNTDQADVVGRIEQLQGTACSTMKVKT